MDQEAKFIKHLRQNYTLVEQLVDIGINNLIKKSMIDINING